MFVVMNRSLEREDKTENQTRIKIIKSKRKDVPEVAVRPSPNELAPYESKKGKNKSKSQKYSKKGKNKSKSFDKSKSFASNFCKPIFVSFVALFMVLIIVMAVEYITLSHSINTLENNVSTLEERVKRLEGIVTSGIILTDKTVYNTQDVIKFKINNPRFNKNPKKIDVIKVRAQNVDTGDTVIVKAIETGVNTGIFEGEVNLSSKPTNNKQALYVRNGDIVVLRYGNGSYQYRIIKIK